jgi:hypothetical protein
MSILASTINGDFDSEPLFTTTSLSNQEKPQQAAPVQNGCVLQGATTTGDVTASPIPIPTIDDAILLGEELISGSDDCWNESARALVAGVILQHWRNQADGFFE